MCTTKDPVSFTMSCASTLPTPDANDECNEECSLGVADLIEDEYNTKEGRSECSQQTVSPISHSDSQELSLLTLSMQTGSALSKLDLLRARNSQIRQRGSLKIAELRRSLNASSSSLLLTPNKKGMMSLSDESTAQTMPSRTWTETSSPMSIKRVCPVPFEVEMTPTDSMLTTSISGSPNISAFDYHMDHCNRLKQENELLRQHMNLLVEHHGFILRKERTSLRLELQNRSKARRNRLRLAILLLMVGCIGQLILNHRVDDAVTSQFDDPSPMLCDLLVVDDANMIKGNADDSVFSADTAPIEATTNVCLEISPIDSTPAVITSSNNTFDGAEVDETPIMLVQSQEPKKDTRRPGLLKQFLFNVRNDHLGVWLKHIKI